MKVCVDPGHGMSNRRPDVYDPGATAEGSGGARFEEARIALRYGLTLKDAFRARGVEVFMTRDDETDPAPVGKRAQAARDAGCEVFVSIHLNDFDDDSANGTETLYRDADDRRFAERLQGAMVRVLGLRDRGIKERTDLAVLRFEGVASLLELGFIGNVGDRERLLDPGVRDALCGRIADETIVHMGWDRAGGARAAMAAGRLGADPTLATEPKEHDWGGGARDGYDLAAPLVVGAVPLTHASFRGLFGDTGVRDSFNMSAFEATVEAWGLRHFAPAELLYLGASHYSGGGCGGLNSLPPQRLWAAMRGTARMADEIRDRFGHPIKVLSAYRDEDYNACIGGETGSQHLVFNALDLTPIGGSLSDMLTVARQVRASSSEFLGGIGYYPGSRFIHIDTRGRSVDW